MKQAIQNNRLMAYKQSQAGDQNIFRLSGLSDTAQPLSVTHFFKEETAPIKNLDAPSKNALPTFNKDNLYFTPTFLLPNERNFYKMNENYHRFIFDKRIEENQTDLKPERHYERIELAPPNSKYCQICQQKYENYFEHTQLPSHAELAKNNAVNLSILQLCSSIQPRPERIGGEGKKKIRKSHGTGTPHKPETRAAKNANPLLRKKLSSPPRVDCQ